MIVSLTKDIQVIAEIVNHPKLYGWLSDDCSPLIYEPDPKSLYLTDDNEDGIVRLDHVNGVCCQVHIAVTPCMWGKGVEFGKKCIEWAIVNTRYIKVIAMIPIYNKLTIRLVKKCGFKQEGLIKKSFLKNWKLHDQVLFGITKREYQEGD